jgi:CheY-like chemotaxis protein/HPt (histidine-containing phosphotransfer) domain-containing protein
LLNLISNAIKFTPHGGEVNIHASLVNQHSPAPRIRIEVSDTGIGMSPATVGKLFQPFSQADSSFTRKYGGTGLGLSICKRLLELMGGEIGVSSEVGRGSTFWFALPLEVASPGLAQETAEFIGADFSHAPALVVTASQALGDVLAYYLGYWKMPLILCGSGEEALSHASAARLAFVEAGIPGMEGAQLAAHLQQLNPDIRSVLLSSQGQRIDAAAEFSATLPLPLKLSALYDTVATLTGDSLAAPVQRIADNQPLPASSHTILIVEDSPVNQRVAALHLRQLGYRSHIAENGEIALRMLEHVEQAQTDYALILMDCQMPVMDGFEATRRIRNKKCETGRHLPIIAMTADITAESRQSCLDAGMDGFLHKPMEPGLLKAMLKQWLPDEGQAKQPVISGRRDAEARIGLFPDFERLRMLFGDDDQTIRELLQVFIKSTSPLLDKMADAIQHDSAADVRAISHQIAGAAANLGITHLHDMARSLEHSAHHDNTSEMLSLYRSMKSDFDVLADFVHQGLTHKSEI